MCGIAGIIDFSGRAVDPALLFSMGQALAHRGPDDEGYVLIAPNAQRMICCCGPATDHVIAPTIEDIRSKSPEQGFRIGLAHRRFSIIDLTSAGHQPFVVTPENWVLAYNGEIYNYLELRHELEQSGGSFTSHTDTEVVLKAYMKWGTDCFQRFNGFWSLAIFDPQRRCVVLSRDRLGVKPLYYITNDDCLYFASEIKALLKVSRNEQAPVVNESVVSNWLEFGIKDHTDATCFSGVSKFPAASWAFADADMRNNVRKFWSIPSLRKSVRELPVAEAVDTCRQLLADAIKLRLRADVPFALSLSGGLDSSTLAAIAKHELGIALPAFTVGFSDASANETAFARSVAESCGCDLTVLEPPPGSVWEHIEAFTNLQEEPYHSPNLYIEQLAWSQMRKQGIKVVLNGAAGDENFGGYGFHYSLLQKARLFRGDLAGYVGGEIGRAHV
jgi:asparagine synthase (glutamine-hydrolysing)